MLAAKDANIHPAGSVAPRTFKEKVEDELIRFLI